MEANADKIVPLPFYPIRARKEGQEQEKREEKRVYN